MTRDAKVRLFAAVGAIAYYLALFGGYKSYILCNYRLTLTERDYTYPNDPTRGPSLADLAHHRGIAMVHKTDVYFIWYAQLPLVGLTHDGRESLAGQHGYSLNKP